MRINSHLQLWRFQPQMHMNNFTFQIRNCKRSDIETIVHIEKTCHGEINNLSIISLVQYLEMFGPAFIVVELNSEPIGFAIGGILLDDNNTTGWLLDIAVLPSFQHKGLGEKLCLEVVQRLNQYNINKIRATVSPDNKASLATLRKANFEPVGEDLNYFGPGQRRLIMQRNIGE